MIFERKSAAKVPSKNLSGRKKPNFKHELSKNRKMTEFFSHVPVCTTVQHMNLINDSIDSPVTVCTTSEASENILIANSVLVCTTSQPSVNNLIENSLVGLPNPLPETSKEKVSFQSLETLEKNSCMIERKSLRSRNSNKSNSMERRYCSIISTPGKRKSLFEYKINSEKKKKVGISDYFGKQTGPKTGLSQLINKFGGK